MTWFALTLVSVTFLALAELIQQHLLGRNESANERTSAIITFLMVAVLAAPMVVVLGLQDSLFILLTSELWFWVIVAGLLGSFGIVFYLRSFKVSSISFSCIFISWSAVVSTCLGILFYGESLHPSKLLGIVCVLVAILVISLKNISLEKNHLFALMAGVLFGITYTIDKHVVTQSHPVIYMIYAFPTVAILVMLQAPRQTVSHIRCLSFFDLIRIAASAVGYFIYNLCTFFAYTRGGEVGRVDAINNAQIFLIILVEYFLFGQRGGVVRKLSSAVLAVVGVALLQRAP